MCSEDSVMASPGGVGRLHEIVHTVSVPRDDGSGDVDHIRFVEGDGGDLLVIANGLMHESYGYTTIASQLRSAIPLSIRNDYERFDVTIRDVDPFAPPVPNTEPPVRRAVGLTERGFVDLSRKRSKLARWEVMRVYRAVQSDEFVRERWKVVRDHGLNDNLDSVFPGLDDRPDRTETTNFDTCGGTVLRVTRKTGRRETVLGTVRLVYLSIPGYGNLWGVTWSSLKTYFKYKGRPVLSQWKNRRDYVIARVGDDGSKDYVLRGDCLVYNIRNRQNASRGRALLDRLINGEDDRWSELLGFELELEPEPSVEVETDPVESEVLDPAVGASSVRSYTYVPEDGEPYGVSVAFFTETGPAVSLADLRRALEYGSHVPLNGMETPADVVVSPVSVPGLSGAKRFLTRSGYEKAYARRVRSDEAGSKVRRFDEWLWRTVAPEIGWELPDRWSETSDGDSGVSDGEPPEAPADSSQQVSTEPEGEVPVGRGLSGTDVDPVLTDETLERIEVERNAEMAGFDRSPDVEVETVTATRTDPIPVGILDATEVPDTDERVMTLVYSRDRARLQVRFCCCQGVVFAVEEDFLWTVGRSASAREAIGGLSDYECGMMVVNGSRMRVLAEFGMYEVLDAMRFHARLDGRGTSEVDSVFRWLATEAIPEVRRVLFRPVETPPIEVDFEGYVNAFCRQILEDRRRVVAENRDEVGVLMDQLRDLNDRNTNLINERQGFDPTSLDGEA